MGDVNKCCFVKETLNSHRFQRRRVPECRVKDLTILNYILHSDGLLICRLPGLCHGFKQIFE